MKDMSGARVARLAQTLIARGTDAVLAELGPPTARPWPELGRTGAPPRVPVDGLPVGMRTFIECLASSLQVPRDLAWVSVVTGAAVRLMDGAVKVAPGWTEPLVLWALAAAGSGESKSPLLRLSSGESQPVRVIEDATPEALASALEGCPRAWLRTAEGASLATVLGVRYGDGAASLLLQSYSGERFVVDRKGAGGPVVLDDPRVTATVFIQPNALGALVSNKTTRDQGAWARFLLVSPESMVGRRQWLDLTPLAPAALEAWNAGLASCRPRTYTLGRDALRAVLSFRQEAEGLLVGAWCPIADWGSKSAGHLVRLAGVCAAFDGAETVSADRIAGLVPAIRALGAHALRVLSSGPGDPLAPRIRAWLLRGRPETVTLRDLARALNKAVAPVSRTVTGLVELGYLRPCPPVRHTRSGRPPGPSFEVRPYSLWGSLDD